ncbi:MAG: trypsin-like serine protease [Pirellulaceae bacterium]|nr:trypsin-like serine protease [Pirellulaceae bacterium]
MENRLYIRIRGRVLGPYDREKLHLMARRGQFGRMHEVSEDGVAWQPASTYGELFGDASKLRLSATAGAATLCGDGAGVAGQPPQNFAAKQHRTWTFRQPRTLAIGGTSIAALLFVIVAVWFVKHTYTALRVERERVAAEQAAAEKENLLNALIDSTELVQKAVERARKSANAAEDVATQAHAVCANVKRAAQHARNAASKALEVANDLKRTTEKADHSPAKDVVKTAQLARESDLAASEAENAADYAQKNAEAVENIMAAVEKAARHAKDAADDAARVVDRNNLLANSIEKALDEIDASAVEKGIADAEKTAENAHKAADDADTAAENAVTLVEEAKKAGEKTDMAARNAHAAVTAAEKVAGDLKDSTLNSIRDHEGIAEAVGKVVIGATITTYDGEQFQIAVSSGSSFTITRDGHMLTNKHVVEEYLKLQRARDGKDDFKRKYNATLEEQIWVFVNKEKHDAELIHVSDKTDYAILRVNRRFAKPFRLKAVPERLLDAEVRAVGFPGAATTPFTDREGRLWEFSKNKCHSDVAEVFNDRELQYVMTAGRISQVTEDTATKVKWILHNAGIARGSSGGPLVLQDATVLGVNTLIARDEIGVGAEFYHAIFFGQFRGDIDKHAPGVVWVP